MMPSSAMSRRRTLVPSPGSFTSVSAMHFGSTFSRQLLSWQATQGLPYLPILMPYGREYGTGGVTSQLLTLAGASRPIFLLSCMVTHRMPQAANLADFAVLHAVDGIRSRR